VLYRRAFRYFEGLSNRAEINTFLMKNISTVKRSSRWAYARKKHLKTEATCQWCGAATNLQVHHIKPFHLFPALELVPSNFLTLCETPNQNCHRRVGHLGAWVRWNPNARVACEERKMKNLTVK
jgi:5-methylcytosine-specific restriction enzyme A